jgi:hypothetical protein
MSQTLYQHFICGFDENETGGVMSKIEDTGVNSKESLKLENTGENGDPPTILVGIDIGVDIEVDITAFVGVVVIECDRYQRLLVLFNKFNFYIKIEYFYIYSNSLSFRLQSND